MSAVDREDERGDGTTSDGATSDGGERERWRPKEKREGTLFIAIGERDRSNNERIGAGIF